MAVKQHSNESPVQQGLQRHVDAGLLYRLGCVAILLLLVIAYVTHNYGYFIDDSYITFRYAENARLGYGLVFNVGQRFYGSTATGFAIVLLAIAKFSNLIGLNWAIPRIATLLSALGIALVGAVILDALWSCYPRCNLWARIVYGLLSLLVLFVLPLSNIVSGQETYFYVGLVSIATYLFLCKKRHYAATLILILATTCRPDVVLLAFLLYCISGAHDVCRGVHVVQVLRKLVPPGIIYLGGIFSWGLWTKLYYGSFLPETLGAKEVQATMGVFPLFNVTNLAQDLTTREFGAGYWKVLAVIPIVALIVSAVLELQRKLNSKPVGSGEAEGFGVLIAAYFAYAVSLSLAYISMRVSIWWWYVSPIGLFLLASAQCGLAELLFGRTNQDNRLKRFAIGTALVLAAVTLASSWRVLFRAAGEYLTTRNTNEHIYSYDYFEGYIRAERPGGATIATAEPGAFGYHMGPRYTLIDVLGLVSPGVIPAIRSGNMLYAVSHYKPRYDIISWAGPYQPNTYPWFGQHYRLVAEFTAPFWESALGRGAYLFERAADQDQLSSLNRIELGAASTPFVSLVGLSLIPKKIDPRWCDLATLGGNRLVTNKPSDVDASEAAEITGWASSPTGHPVGSIFVQLHSISGLRYTARARYRADDYAIGNNLRWGSGHYPSGFRGVFDFRGVAPGTYTIGLLYYANGSLSECSHNRSVTVRP